jgi:hypothetical protein
MESDLVKFIREHLVIHNYGHEYCGIKEPSLAELGALQVLVQQEIEKKLRDPNGNT